VTYSLVFEKEMPRLSTRRAETKFLHSKFVGDEHVREFQITEYFVS